MRPYTFMDKPEVADPLRLDSIEIPGQPHGRVPSVLPSTPTPRLLLKGSFDVAMRPRVRFTIPHTMPAAPSAKVGEKQHEMLVQLQVLEQARVEASSIEVKATDVTSTECRCIIPLAEIGRLLPEGGSVLVCAVEFHSSRTSAELQVRVVLDLTLARHRCPDTLHSLTHAHRPPPTTSALTPHSWMSRLHWTKTACSSRAALSRLPRKAQRQSPQQWRRRPPRASRSPGASTSTSGCNRYAR